MKPADLEKIYKSLANRRRLAIIKYLSNNERGTVWQISEHLKLSFKSTSKHLQILKQAGFVENEQINKERQYYLIDQGNPFIKQVLNIL